MPGRGALSKDPKKENTLSFYGKLNKRNFENKGAAAPAANAICKNRASERHSFQ